MRVTDNVLKMGNGGNPWEDRKITDEGYGTSLETSGYVYGEDTNWEGTGINKHLPIINIQGNGDYNIGTGDWLQSGESECTPGSGQHQCQGTMARRISASFGGMEGYGLASEILSDFQPNREFVNTAIKEGGFEGAFGDYAGNYGAWHLKSLLNKTGKGSIMWENSDNAGFDYNSIKEVTGDLRIGDIVTLRRKSGKNPHSESNMPGYNMEEGVTHIGAVVGQTADGIPIIEHSWSNKGVGHRTKREPLNNMSLHAPASIIRYNKKGESGYTPSVTATENSLDGVNLPEYEALTGIYAPAKFENIADFDMYLNDLGDDLRSRLSNISTYTSEGRDFNVVDLTDSGYNFINENTTVWEKPQTDKEIKQADRMQRKEDRKAKRAANQARREEVETQDTPTFRRGGLLYIAE